MTACSLYFGYPQAHEDDAERAVRAGLELTSEYSTNAANRCPIGEDASVQ